jgi:YidC/Oxa1 family membrane protein insertase
MWDWIINPFVTTLTFLYSVMGNNVVLAIVVFTILVRLITLPLTLQQQKSTKAMQQLQPELKKLQEKYKDDREKLAQAQMSLYREYGVNPAGGCLPLIIQMPILLGLYQAIIFALASTPYQLMELSGRLLIPGLDNLVPLQNTFLGMNLTQPPSMVNIFSFALPILVVVTTWLQFKMTMPQQPTTDDDGKPNQAAAMTQSMGTVMPLMYGFFALSFSVGLSIYFIVSNVVGILQYWLTTKYDLTTLFGGKPVAVPVTPPVIEGKPARASKAVEPKVTPPKGKATPKPGKAK